MKVFNVRIEVPVEASTIAAALTDYGWTPWWAVSMSEPDEHGKITVEWNHDGEQHAGDKPDERAEVGLWMIADAFATMAGGRYESYDGTRKSLSEYHAQAARDILISPTEADADADTIDYAVQMAVLGGVIFG
jgi:hypothetical protein